MLTVRDLMAPDPITLEQEETLRSAAELLTDAGVGGAPVVQGDRVVGVVSLTDILTFEAGEPGVPTYRPDLTGPYDDGGDGDETELLEDTGSRWFVEMWQDAGSDVTGRMDEAEGPEWDALDEHTVAEVMSRRVLSVAPDAPLEEAARVMSADNVHRVLVVEGGVAVGILTASDLVRAVARGVLVPGEAAAAAAVRM